MVDIKIGMNDIHFLENQIYNFNIYSNSQLFYQNSFYIITSKQKSNNFLCFSNLKQFLKYENKKDIKLNCL